MRPVSRAVLAFITITFGAATSAAQNPIVSAGKNATQWSRVDQILGRHGTVNPGAVMKYGFPRGDMRVMLDGVQVKPAFALGSWVAFKRVGGMAMAMGDLVLAEDEVAGVMQRLQDGGVQQTALHNHLLGESPRVLYMHISAHGDEAKIAQAIHDALALTRTPLAAPATPAPAPALDLDTLAIARELGVAGKANGGVYQVSVPRQETIRDDGREVPPSMGVATGINFQPTGAGRALVTGDFVLLAGEVNPVIRALRASGIAVTALHMHMLNEQPRLFFMHFLGNDDAVKLARGLRAALDRTASKK